MASAAEQHVARGLRAALAVLPDGAAVPESDDLREALSALEWFLPGVPRDPHPKSPSEAYDGVYPFETRKTGDREAELFGLVILISDQSLVPVHLRLRVSAEADEVTWLECRIGERSRGKMLRPPYGSLNALWKRYYVGTLRPDAIDWAYAVTYGDRAS